MPEHDDIRQRVRRQRRTRLVVWGTFLVAVVALYSFFSAGFFLYAVAVITGVALVSGTLASANLTGISASRNVARTELRLGEETEVYLTLKNDKKVPAWWLYWREETETTIDTEGPTSGMRSLGAGERIEVRYKLRPRRRGLYRIGPALIDASDPFGLVHRTRLDAAPTFVTVQPKVVSINPDWPLGHLPVLRVPRRQSLFEDPARFVGVREYRAGDNLRRIHWRATARARRLQTKLFEPVALQGTVVVVDADPDHTTRLELAITAAASITRYVIDTGHAVGLLSNGADAAERYPEDWHGDTLRKLHPDSAVYPATSTMGAADVGKDDRLDRVSPRLPPISVSAAAGSWQGRRILNALARLVPGDAYTLAELLTAEFPRLSRSLILFIVTANLDTELSATLHTLQQSGFELAVVWIRDAVHDELPPRPEGTPVYPVSDPSELEWLGTHAL